MDSFLKNLPIKGFRKSVYICEVMIKSQRSVFETQWMFHISLCTRHSQFRGSKERCHGNRFWLSI